MTTAGHRAVFGAMLALAVGAVALAVQDGDGDVRPRTSPAAAAGEAAPPPSPPAPAEPAATTATTAVPPTTLAPGVSVPVGAVGAYTPAAGGTPVTGAGPLTTYHVEVEDALGYSVDEFARIVDETLADPRSWTADGALSFQRVASGGQIRIVLATPGTVDQLCLPLRTLGRWSCHNGGTVALNGDRWLQGTEDWPGPLDQYRAYAVNHEVGHAIGHGHVTCPGAGQPAPVMMQQSMGLDGCLPNGWPFP